MYTVRVAMSSTAHLIFIWYKARQLQKSDYYAFPTLAENKHEFRSTVGVENKEEKREKAAEKVRRGEHRATEVFIEHATEAGSVHIRRN